MSCDAADGMSPQNLLLHVLVGEFANDGCESTSSCDMDSDVWGRLPDELLLTVMRMLPYRSKHRFRTVSQLWHTLLSSPPLLEGSSSGFPRLCGLQYLPVAPAEIVGQQSARIQRAKTIELDLSYLPAQFLGWEMIAGGEIGLVVLANLNGDTYSAHTKFCVLNPMTRAWKQLPTIDLPSSLLVKLLVNRGPSGSGFDLCAVFSSRGRVGSESKAPVALYHSGSTEWHMCEVESPLCEQLVMHGDRMCHLQDWDEDQHSFLTVFRLEDGKLVREVDLDLPDPPEQGNFALVMIESFLVTCAHHVHLVRHVMRDTSLALEVWKLSARTWCHLSTIQLTKADALTTWISEAAVFSVDNCIYYALPYHLLSFNVHEKSWERWAWPRGSTNLFMMKPNLDHLA